MGTRWWFARDDYPRHDLPWIYVWRIDGFRAYPISVHQPAGNVSSRSDAELDGFFEALGRALANPRLEGATLVADVVCLAGDRGAQIHSYAVRGGEDGVFDTVVEVG
jgi:hypothetical protein